MKIKTFFFCVRCFFIDDIELKVVVIESKVWERQESKQKNWTFFKCIIKTWCFFPKKWVIENIYVIAKMILSFFLSQLNPSKTSIHFLVRISFTGQIKKNNFGRKKTVVDIFFWLDLNQNSEREVLKNGHPASHKPILNVESFTKMHKRTNKL